MEMFYSLQGEGYHQGKAAYFIRLAGCDVGCVWCDVKESWSMDAHPRWMIEQIAAEVEKSGANLAVITGGEPLMHSLDALTNLLLSKNIACHLETSGSHPLSGEWDWICLSPKKFKAPLEENIALSSELKVVIFNKHDFEWAETFATLINDTVHLYTNNEFEVEDAYLTYYRQPVKIQINGCSDPYTGITSTTNVDCEFKDDIIELIIDEAVSI